IDPDRLLILRMRFLDEAQRELLERLGIAVVDEREERLPVEPAYYEVLVEFSSSALRGLFRQLWSAGTWGGSAVEDVRGAGGAIHDRRLMLRFPNLQAARAFQEADHAGCRVPLEVRGREKKISWTTSSVLTVQFADRAALDRFFVELQARRDGVLD